MWAINPERPALGLLVGSNTHVLPTGDVGSLHGSLAGFDLVRLLQACTEYLE